MILSDLGADIIKVERLGGGEDGRAMGPFRGEWGAYFVALNRGKLEHRVYGVPADIDAEIAALKLATMGIAIDVPSDAQRAYLASWTSGT